MTADATADAGRLVVVPGLLRDKGCRGPLLLLRTTRSTLMRATTRYHGEVAPG